MRSASLFLLFSALSAYAQQLPSIAFSGGGGGSRDNQFQGSAVFHLPLPDLPTVANVPFSGEQTGEIAHSDGTTTPTGLHQKAMRDTQGRIRIDQPFIDGPNTPPETPILVEIVDPVAHFAYILDDIAKVAHRIALPAAPAPSAASAPSPDPNTQDLGTQTISGVLAYGTRSTPTADRTVDTWVSRDLHLTLRTVTTDARGVKTVEIAHLETTEPDPARFRIPPDYQVVDETAPSFTIEWGAR